MKAKFSSSLSESAACYQLKQQIGAIQRSKWMAPASRVVRARTSDGTAESTHDWRQSKKKKNAKKKKTKKLKKQQIEQKSTAREGAVKILAKRVK